jgi:hypothetical protein
MTAVEELSRALKLLDWARNAKNSDDDALEYLESAARDVVDLYLPPEEQL